MYGIPSLRQVNYRTGACPEVVDLSMQGLYLHRQK